MNKPLLILDLDETLVFATENTDDQNYSFLCGHFFVFTRPHLQEFLDSMELIFDFAVWTSSGESYMECVIENALQGRKFEFTWSRDRCTRKFDAERYEEYWVKDLRKVRKLGYDIQKVVVADDTPRKLERSYGNLVQVSEWVGSPQDCELLDLEKYLKWLCAHQDFREVEKRGWRTQQLTMR